MGDSPRHIALLICDMGSGGAQRVAALLASEWAKSGARVSIITYEAPQTALFFDVSDKVEMKQLDLQGESGGLVCALRANFQRVRAVRAALKALKPDVVLSFLADMTVTSVLATKGLNIPVIACERTDPNVYPSGIIWRYLRDLAYARCASIVCQTERAAMFFKKNGNAIVIPNPVVNPDTLAETDISVPERAFIASMGRLSREKGHDVLIDAFSRLATDFPDLDLLIIGEGAERQNLESQIERLSLKGRIHLPGTSKHPFSTLKKAQLFVLPSRFEGFPNALCEAMALGLPCVATSAAQGVIRDKENGVLVLSEDSAAQAEAMRTLLSDPELSQNLGREAQNILKEFSLTSVLKQWDAVLP